MVDARDDGTDFWRAPRTLIARSGQTATADRVHPSDPDRMGVFSGPDGGSLVVTNHENSGDEDFQVPTIDGLTDYPGAIGGTCTIAVEAAGNPLEHYTVSSHGGLILAEDGGSISHRVGVTSEGHTYPLARNDFNNSEFCGPAFSADGKILFANIQSPGFTLAITGPWGNR